MLKQAEQGSGAGRAGRAGRVGKAGRAGRQNGRARHFAIRVHHSKTMADLLPNGSFEHFSWCRSTCKVAYHPVGHLASSQRTSFTCKVAYRPAGHFASTRRASSGRPGQTPLRTTKMHAGASGCHFALQKCMPERPDAVSHYKNACRSVRTPCRITKMHAGEPLTLKLLFLSSEHSWSCVSPKPFYL